MDPRVRILPFYRQIMNSFLQLDRSKIGCAVFAHLLALFEAAVHIEECLKRVIILIVQLHSDVEFLRFIVQCGIEVD